jgi:molybdate transport system substrate-binding protein
VSKLGLKSHGFPHEATQMASIGQVRLRFSAQRRKRHTVPVAVVALVILLAACGKTSASGGSSSSSDTITVAAAASLTQAFTEIGQDFEAKNPGGEVTFSFGSSATLATQISQGAPIDVFAAASPATMKTVTDAGIANPPVDFASNTLQIAVPKGNPGKITGLSDFTDESKKVAICAPQVPCGAAAIKVFAAAKIVPAPDTLEQDVKAVLQRVESDEVDVALVYRTDVLAAGDNVEGIDFPQAARAVNIYQIATLKASENAAFAQRFVEYVRSFDGQAVLSEAGFGRPKVPA